MSVETKTASNPSSKTASNKPNGQTEQIKAAAEKAKQVVTFTPSQAIGIFTENLPKDQSSKLKSLYDDLLSEFAQESQSRISIGKTLIQTRELLGENFGKFLQDCVVKVLRKSPATCYNYIALSQAFSLKFAKNNVIATALFRIWGAEGAFDSVNGELKPAVDQAIGACGGIPETKDSATCETWARKFIETCDALVKQGRSAQVTRGWDAETMATKHANVVKAFRSFITNKSVSAKRASKLLVDVLVEAMQEMSGSEIRTALETAAKQIGEKKADIKEHAENQQLVA